MHTKKKKKHKPTLYAFVTPRYKKAGDLVDSLNSTNRNILCAAALSCHSITLDP